jgi:quercetin dioxygenase-like cupin family protein
VIVSRSERVFRQLPGRESADPFEGIPTSELSVRVVRVGSSERRSPHRHPHSREAIYVIRGGGWLWEDGVRQRIEAGDCVLIEAGTAHATLPDPGSSLELVCFFPHPDLNANVQELEEIVIGHSQGEPE